MTKNSVVGEFIAEALVVFVGWGFCLAILSGFYSIGYALADHFAGSRHSEAMGLLSAIVFVWLYEHRQAHERWTKLLNQPRA